MKYEVLSTKSVNLQLKSSKCFVSKIRWQIQYTRGGKLQISHVSKKSANWKVSSTLYQKSRGKYKILKTSDFRDWISGNKSTMFHIKTKNAKSEMLGALPHKTLKTLKS